MPTKLALPVIAFLSMVLFGCDGDRTTDFCGNICECAPDGEVDGCNNQCVSQIDSLESSNSGAPIVTDECFACANHTTCELFLTACSSECAAVFAPFDQQPVP